MFCQFPLFWTSLFIQVSFKALLKILKLVKFNPPFDISFCSCFWLILSLPFKMKLFILVSNMLKIVSDGVGNSDNRYSSFGSAKVLIT